MALALFDLDNTLVDRSLAFAAAVPFLATHYDRDPDELVPFVLDHDQDGGVGWETWMAATIERFELPTTVEEMTIAFRPHYLAGYQLAPEVAAGLVELRSDGWRIGVVTNGPPNQLDKIRGTGLDQMVDGWVVSQELGVAKPDRRIFAEAARRCGEPRPNGVGPGPSAGSITGSIGWMVGDSGPADIAGAHNAGLTSIWLPRGRTWDGGVPPDHEAPDAAAAIALIRSSR